ncbi:Brain mitochondrial carrier protein 1 [Myotis davidii]|uniref:Brain mitochondrial carrier protein 1 n=4 Tax=Yangochiroptera TaxID=30560 RepID=L5LH89_MYODS|nr:Brain mitochondrial carrier protein 1 [Myotis davidii]
MPAPLLPRQQLGYFRWFQCFRVGAAVVFPTVGASASQSSDEPEQHQKSDTGSHEMSGLNWKPFVYGGLASIVAEFGTFPVDLTKTRLQVQGQSIDARFKEIKYRGMFHALFRIYKEEGVLALYSGIAPALLRQASYGTIKIGIYQSLKRLFVERLEDETLLINMICGVVSGVISSTIANPTDVLKILEARCMKFVQEQAFLPLAAGTGFPLAPGTQASLWLLAGTQDLGFPCSPGFIRKVVQKDIRMQAQGSLFQGSMIGSFIDIYQQEGTKGLWRGVVPTAQRAAIVVGVELPVYDITKKHLILSGVMGDTILTHFVSSFTCGLAGALASNPVDVVRTRMMNQRAIVGHVDLYKGTLDGILKMWKHEGFFALYKGFWPNWLRLGPWNIIFFITYEQLKRLQI